MVHSDIIDRLTGQIKLLPANRRHIPIDRRRTSRSLHVNSQSQSGASDLILKRQPHKLSLALAQRVGEASRPFRTDCSTALLDIAEVRSGDAEELRELSKTSRVSLAQPRQRGPERQWPSHQGFEVR
jgi:hypothetical protein